MSSKMDISIHAPRAGSDSVIRICTSCGAISIHAPRAGSDVVGEALQTLTFEFQSTLPVRGATAGEIKSDLSSTISIHAPRAGSDQQERDESAAAKISIHAPRAGSDALPSNYFVLQFDFNPRSPCGERLWLLGILVKQFDFNPRSPCGERPLTALAALLWSLISIHAPRAGSDVEFPDKSDPYQYISIHAPRAGSDEGDPTQMAQKYQISIHAPRAGSDLRRQTVFCVRTDFNPRSPCGERPC